MDQVRVRFGGGVHPRVLAYAAGSARRDAGRRGPFVAPPASPTQAGLIDFTAERERHVRFVGRDDVMARLDEWLLDAKDTRWVFVTGGPGMGKSAILAAW